MFFISKKLKKIQKSLRIQQGIIDSYIDKMADTDRLRIEWCTVHQRECMSTGLLMWEKDLDNRYTFLNTRHCNDFFRISFSKVKSLIGKTDMELLSDFTSRTGLKNTFGDMCQGTDQYTLKINKSCRFWEMGYVGDDIFILDVTKKPLVKEGVIVGTKGWALNQSAKECEIKALLELFLKTGEAIKLNTGNERAAVYCITKVSNTFNGRFPT